MEGLFVSVCENLPVYVQPSVYKLKWSYIMQE